MKRQTWRHLQVAALCGMVAGAMAPRLQALPVDDAQLQKPALVALPLPTKAPAGAVELFTGKPEQMRANWYKRYSKDPSPWTVDAEGVASPAKSDITSVQEFGDCFLHAEFVEPMTGGGNSGVSFQGRYEVQILNSFGQEPEPHGCAALYSQKAAAVTASKPAGEWQTYDIIFRAPRFDADGKVIERARVTVFQNGILVQNNAEFNGPTGIQYGEFKGEAKTGPIILQGDHDPVKFRNVWVLPM